MNALSPSDVAAANRPGDATCPAFHAAIELIGRRWNGVLLQQLLGGPLRFHELRDRIAGITDAMLSQRLKDLEASGIVVRTVGTGRPVMVSYELTTIGHQLSPILDAVASWGAELAAALPRDSADVR